MKNYLNNIKSFNVWIALVIFIFISFFQGCQTFQKIAPSSEPPVRPDSLKTHAAEDTVKEQDKWIIPNGTPKYLRPRTWDLIHQKIHVRFRFKQQKVFGNTELLLTSFRHENNILTLDAKTIALQAIRNIETGQSLTFQKNEKTVEIKLNKAYQEGDTLQIAIDYTAQPNHRGIYFIDPTSNNPAEPTQVWTFGHPEDNSYWLPTIDLPSERATQETWISVPDTMQTVSNGRLMSQRVYPGDSLRTDYWVMDKPHAPYLFALAAGSFKQKSVYKHGMVYKYYTDPSYFGNVDEIFRNTSDMGQFYQSKLNVPYAWGTYAQLPVHQFVAHGMENTTATFLYDGAEFDRRAGRDLSNQDLIVHEFAHQWFGDLVTPANWANMAMSEGFASFMETLYRLNHDGKASAIWHNMKQKESYFDEAQRVRHAIIFNRYNIPQDLYDHHTYEKANRVLRMLYNYVGQDTFWQGLHDFLDAHKYGTVTVNDLQQIFERETGERLNWFFNQWYKQPGHPTIKIQPDTTGNGLAVRIRQVQDTTRQPIFKLFPTVEIQTTSGTKDVSIEINQVDSIYHFSYSGKFKDFIFDPNDVQLAQIDYNIPQNQLLRRLHHPSVAVRYKALTRLNALNWDSTITQAIMGKAKGDAFWGIRQTAFDLMNKHFKEVYVPLIMKTNHQTDSDYRVRKAALQVLRHDTTRTQALKIYLKNMVTDSSYFVAAQAIKLYGRKYPKDAWSVLKDFANENSYNQVLRNAYARAMADATEPEAVDDLFAMAHEQGSWSYIPIAIESLIEQAKRRDEIKPQLLSLCRDLMFHSYGNTRRACYNVFDQFHDPQNVPILEKLKSIPALPQPERRSINEILDSMGNEE